MIAWKSIEESATRTVEVAGHKIRYVMQGEGHPVILVHGSGASLYTWRHVLPVLAQKYQVFALDLPGFGFSDKPRIHYTPQLFADTLNSFIDCLKLERVHLVGSSIGASICALVALDSPAKVDRLVLIDPRTYAKRPVRFISKLLATPILGPILLTFFNTRSMTAKSIREYYFDPKVADDNVIDEYYRPLLTRGSTWSLHSTMRNTDYSQLFGARAMRIQQQTLILWGEQDNLFPLSEGERLAKEIPNAQLHVVRNAGHLPHEERYDEVNDCILQFLAGTREHPRLTSLPRVSL